MASRLGSPLLCFVAKEDPSCFTQPCRLLGAGEEGGAELTVVLVNRAHRALLASQPPSFQRLTPDGDLATPSLTM